MKRYLIQFFNYLRAIWEGKDQKPSIKRILAIAFSIDFIRNFSYAVRKWSEGRSMDGLSSTLMIEGALIASLLGLTSYYNYMERKLSSQNGEQLTPPGE